MRATGLQDGKPRTGLSWLALEPLATAWLIIFDTTPSVLSAEPIIDSRMNTLVSHLKVRFDWISPAPLLALRKPDAIWRFEPRNLFFQHHNSLPPELDLARRPAPRVATSPRRPALLGRQSGHERP